MKASKLIIFLALFVYTQKLTSQNLYFSAGLNSSRMLVYDKDSYYGFGTFYTGNGFQIGLSNEFPISKILSLESGLTLINRNYIFKLLQFRELEKKEQQNTYYLKMPATVKLSLRNTNSLRVFINAGPYFSIGVGGNIKIDGYGWYGITEGTRKIRWGYGQDDDIKSLDTGLTFSIGVEFKSIQLSLGHDYGLSKLTNLSNVSYHNSSYYFNIAYKFLSEKSE